MIRFLFALARALNNLNAISTGKGGRRYARRTVHRAVRRSTKGWL
jgi:hypothetical protein